MTFNCPLPYLSKYGTLFYLHRTESNHPDPFPFYYFSRKAEGAIDKIPDGYELGVASNGKPVLRKIRHYMPDKE